MKHRKEFIDYLGEFPGLSKKKYGTLYQYVKLCDKLPSELTTKSVHNYLVKHKENVKASTIMNHYLYFLELNDVPTKASYFKLKDVVRRYTKANRKDSLAKNFTYITEEEYVRLKEGVLKYFRNRRRAVYWWVLMSLMYEGGLRVSEAKKVRLEMIDFKSDVCKVILPGTITKNSKSRTVMLDDKTKEFLLLNRTGEVGSLFPKTTQDSKEEVTRQYVWTMLKRIAYFCNVKVVGRDSSIRTHDFRRGCSMRWKIKGWTLRQRQKYLGHARITTTGRYDHLFPSEIEDQWKKTMRA